jgi:peroxiredoxin
MQKTIWKSTNNIMRKGIGVITMLMGLMLLTGCGEKRQTFRLEGTFKGFNQGEVYICGIDGNFPIDTVAVVKSQFHYEVALEDPTAFIIIFPNYSEVPVYGEKGAEVTIEGDVSHLREIDVDGTDENEVLTKYRKKTSQQTPPEVALTTEQFIKDNPTSPFALYLIRKVFIQSPQPDYKRAADLMAFVIQANPKGSDDVKAQMKWMEGLTYLKDGGRLPSFIVTDIKGETVKSADLNAKVNVITVWNTINFEGMGTMRQLQKKQKEVGSNSLKVITVCLDANVQACQQILDRDSITFSTICDKQLWDTPIIQHTGLSYIPDNILIDDKGKIIAHSLPQNELMSRIDKLLPKQEEP